MTIKIEWLTDSYDCEYCGGSEAHGAVVTLPDGTVLDFSPYSHCYDPISHEPSDIYRATIAHLGYTIVEKYEVEDSEY